MITLVQHNIESIRALCRKHHVRSLYLVGSAAAGDRFRSDSSDIDFLYRFRKEDIPEGEYADNYFDLLFSLEELLRKKVDLVAEEKISNPYFFESINRNKQFIYGY